VGSGGRAKSRRTAARRSRGGSRRSDANLTWLGKIVYKFRFLLNTRTLIVIVLAWIVYEGALSQHSVVNLYKFKKEKSQLEQELATAEAKRDSLKRQIELIESDDFTIEKLAREKMGLAKEGEIIYRYEEPAEEESEEAPLTPPIVDEGDHKAEKPDDSDG
jgi:cell division protein FtsB